MSMYDAGKNVTHTRAVVTTFSQGKNKIPFYKKQVINESARVIFGLAWLVIL